MENSPYLDRPALSERERRLVDMVAVFAEAAAAQCDPEHCAYGRTDWADLRDNARALLAELDQPEQENRNA